MWCLSWWANSTWDNGIFAIGDDLQARIWLDKLSFPSTAKLRSVPFLVFWGTFISQISLHLTSFELVLFRLSWMARKWLCCGCIQSECSSHAPDVKADSESNNDTCDMAKTDCRSISLFWFRWNKVSWDDVRLGYIYLLKDVIIQSVWPWWRQGIASNLPYGRSETYHMLFATTQAEYHRCWARGMFPSHYFVLFSLGLWESQLSCG